MKRSKKSALTWILSALSVVGLALWLGACAMSFPLGQSPKGDHLTSSPDTGALLLQLFQEPQAQEEGLPGPVPVLECYAGAFLGSPDAGASLPVVASSCWQPLLRFQISHEAVAHMPTPYPPRP